MKPSKCDSCDFDVMACADRCPNGFRMIPVQAFGRYGMVYAHPDPKNPQHAKLYQMLKIPKGKQIKDCKEICGYTDMKRPHLGCVLTRYLHIPVCRLYAVWKGMISCRTEVVMHMVLLNVNRPRWKHDLCAAFSTLQEVTAT